MEEIEAIFWERNADITAFKNPEAKRNDLLAKERARVQRENWILKVIKTVKVFTLEQKKYSIGHSGTSTIRCCG